MSDSSGEDNIPDASTCQKLIDNFANVTGSDQALSQFFLQEADWIIERAITTFFENQGGPSDLSRKKHTELSITYDSSKNIQQAPKPTTVPPSRFSFLSWNIDGLDEHNLKKRTKAVAKLIEGGRYDIVFLQEVIPATLNYLQDKLPQYLFVYEDDEGYFVVTLLNRLTVHFDSSMKHAFPNTTMGRSILHVDAHIGCLKLRLFNTHLESTAEFAAQRTVQLRNAMELLTSANPGYVSILAGDLNARDKEVASVGIAENVCDLWIKCGQRPECKYTWDLQRNSNKSFPGRFQPRLRFDRAFLHQTQPLVDARHFGLEGIQKVAATQSFPSDHWGIQVYFAINPTVQECDDVKLNTLAGTSTTSVKKSVKLENEIGGKEDNIVCLD